jgi:hypothetical protein
MLSTPWRSLDKWTSESSIEVTGGACGLRLSRYWANPEGRPFGLVVGHEAS